MNTDPKDGRSLGLGASEAAAACGLSPWTSPLELFLRKVGRAPEADETLPMRVGKALEPVVLHAFTERHGMAVERQQERIIDPALPWRWATVDGITAGAPALVEAKTAGSLEGWGEDGSDQIPLHYMLQVQHAMACAGLTLAYVPVLFFAREFRCFEIPRNDDIIAALTDQETAFWGHVTRGDPPPAITTADVRLAWPQDSGATITATEAILDTMADLVATRADIKALEKRDAEMTARVQAFMAEAATLAGPDGKALATWKTQSARRLDTKALRAAQPALAEQFTTTSTSRVFRLK